MPKRIFFAIFVFLLLINFYFFTPAPSLFAAASIATPTPTGTTTCDPCGWCNKEINPTPPANWADCHKCLFDSSGKPRDRTYYTVLGCFSTDPSGGPFVRSVLSIIFGMAGGTAFLMVLWGSAMVLTSSGDPIRLQSGKSIIISSVTGILLILFSTFLLSVVGVDILKIPGFGK